jgi:nucleotide-binding universal stress UspA family protein
MQEVALYKHIIVAIDGTELTPKVLEHALAIAREAGAKVEVVTVTEPSVLVAPGAELITISTRELLEELEKAKAAEARVILAGVQDAVKASGVSADYRHVRQQIPSDGIIQVAEELGADLIVMGSHGRRGIKRLLLGSQASDVLARSKVPVLIVK